MYLLGKASAARIREAEKSRNNRLEVIKALSHGTISRRELVKWGIFTSSGVLALKNGLNPFVGNAWSAIPTNMPSSPLFGALPFTQPMPRADLFPRQPISALTPAPTAQANTTQQVLNKALPGVMAGDTGPIEGRPPGPIWAHQDFATKPPKVAVIATQEGAKVNTTYNPGVASQHNSGIVQTTAIAPKFHPLMPAQLPSKMWTFNGSVPIKLLQGVYGEPILFRHYNKLPADITQNGGFGRHTTSTHEHNGHHGAENDGFTGAFFYPGQFYDYHWPIVHAGFRSVNTAATDPKCGAPNGSGGITKLPGDWHETMSSHWFHDHMFSFTSQNVYKGNAALFNLYSALDRGNEALNDGVNLRLPSGRAKDWGNLEYDVNMAISDKAWDANGQLLMDIFDFDGFLGDRMTVNLAYKPYFEVERRKYRFRFANASVSRFFKLALNDGKPMIQIGNDGNLLPGPVMLTETDEMGIGERYDIVIDFSRYSIGQRVSMVNLVEHGDGKGPKQDLTLGEALSGTSSDPCVGKFLEFRVVRDPAVPDVSQVPAVLIPNPDLSLIPVSRERAFEWGGGAAQTFNDPESSFHGPWGAKVDGGSMLAADFGRVSAMPKFGTREIWNLRNGGGGWDHPIHIHFEEGQILQRNGSLANVPLAERGRKDVYRLRPSGSVKITMQFRDWGGMFMEHCHNTVHEDNAMLLRWEINDGGAPFLRPLPTPIPTPQGVTFHAPLEILPNA